MCFYISIDQCKPRKQDMEIRQEIFEYLKTEFGKCYPSCCVHIYGSSHNGFGLRQSDLDICIELKDNVCSFYFFFFLSTNFYYRMKNRILLF
jgi:DNA polymerase sigma